ncbi:hypothetical protein MKW94_023842 [Papaver nudicaule]|uniref:Uncharacterized protein n=1 Tax=Papaver nudicaule TaxID=74823 RepID=A0AA41VEL5_PAPNU|nr:hypothetical protein [Papaver nudicaule]
MAKPHFSFSPAVVGFVFVLLVLHLRDVSSTPPSLEITCNGAELLNSSRDLSSCDDCEAYCNANASGFYGLHWR